MKFAMLWLKEVRSEWLINDDTSDDNFAHAVDKQLLENLQDKDLDGYFAADRNRAVCHSGISLKERLISLFIIRKHNTL